MSAVRGHTRTVKGRKRPVRAHSRKLQPRRAGRNAKRAYRSAKRRRHSDAAVYGSLALAEIGAWVTMRGAAFAFTTLGLMAIGLGVAARRAAG